MGSSCVFGYHNVRIGIGCLLDSGFKLSAHFRSGISIALKIKNFTSQLFAEPPLPLAYQQHYFG